MSLIQDALKRQQQESEENKAPLRVAPSPSVPETMAVPPRPDSAPPARATPLARTPPAPKAEKAGPSWKRVAGIVIFCILLAWMGVLAIMFFNKMTGRVTLGSILPALTHWRKAPSQAPVLPPAAAVPKPAVAPAAVPAPWISLKAAAAPAYADEEEDAEEAAASEANESEVPESVAAPLPAPVAWPRLKLSAIFSNIGSGQAGARLNNRLILVGDQIEGAVLVEIRRDGVMLKCGTETRFLKMGSTLH